MGPCGQLSFIPVLEFLDPFSQGTYVKPVFFRLKECVLDSKEACSVDLSRKVIYFLAVSG